ncbi:MAG: hypothetical protein RR350_07890 [Oscillibacter sp.]
MNVFSPAELPGNHAAAIAQSGLDLSPLTRGNFHLRNLLPVTLGNMVGRTGIGAMMWYAYLRKNGERD